MKKIELEFQRRVTGDTRLEHFRNELAHHMNGVLWHPTVDAELDQLMKGWIIDTFVCAITERVDTSMLSSHSNSAQPLLIDSMKELLLGAATERLVLADPSSRPPCAPEGHSLENQGTDQKKARRPPLNSESSEARMSELSYINPPSVENAQSIAAFWLLWSKACLAYLCVWAPHTLLNLFGVALFNLSTEEISLVFIEDELECMLEQLERLKTIECADLAQCIRETYAPALSKVAVWGKNPWTDICRHIKQRASVDLLKDLDKGKPQIEFRSQEHSQFRTINVSDFQAHILERIKAHAMNVERAWLGSATMIEIELQNMLSQVWKLIREDTNMVEKQSIEDGHQETDRMTGSGRLDFQHEFVFSIRVTPQHNHQGEFIQLMRSFSQSNSPFTEDRAIRDLEALVGLRIPTDSLESDTKGPVWDIWQDPRLLPGDTRAGMNVFLQSTAFPRYGDATRRL